MTNTVESICYEYSEDVLFSQDISDKGDPVKIICYINSHTICNYHTEKAKDRNYNFWYGVHWRIIIRITSI